MASIEEVLSQKEEEKLYRKVLASIKEEDLVKRRSELRQVLAESTVQQLTVQTTFSKEESEKILQSLLGLFPKDKRPEVARHLYEVAADKVLGEEPMDLTQD